jgi:hypothetical protein
MEKAVINRTRTKALTQLLENEWDLLEIDSLEANASDFICNPMKM